MLVALRMLIARSVSDLKKELRSMTSSPQFDDDKVQEREYSISSYLPKSTLREPEPPYP